MPDNTVNPNRLFRCLQVNLRHSKVASASLAEVILENKFDVILIQEPYAKNSNSPAVSNIPPGYISFHSLSKDHAYGSAVLVRLSLATTFRAVCRSQSNHIAAVDLHTPLGTFRFISAYLRPSISDVVTQFISGIGGILTKLSIVAVDSNALNKIWNSKCTNARGTELESVISDNCLQILNQPLDQLSFVPAGTSFLDLTLAGSSVKSARWFFPSIPSMSDHPYIYFEINQQATSSSPSNSGRTKVRTHHISRINVDQFRGKVSAAIKLLSKQSCESTQSIDLSIEELCAIISSAACSSRTRKLFEPGARNMPWWSKELCGLRHKTRQAFKLWSAQRTEVNKNTFKVLKASYQREVRKAKQGAWKLLCNSNPGSSDLFSALNAASGKLSCISLPAVICIDGIEISEPLAILEKCAQHFFPEPPPSEDAHLPAEKLAESYSFSSHSPSFIFPPITSEELASAVASMNVKSSPGLDGLSTALINSCFPLITDHLLKIMNACFSLSYFPTCWKAAKVVVIGKPNKPAYDSFNSFRPISVVNTLAKVLEKLILNRVRWVASTCQWLSPSQHGFIQGRSTESAAHSLISFCESSNIAKCTTACAFLDIKSAFDAAWHPAIISALDSRHCPRYLTQLIMSFLSDRTALFSLNESSLTVNVGLGCPQGGVLSPFLWSVLIDDVLRLCFPFLSFTVGYADDLTVATAHKDPTIATRNLQIMCDQVNNWCLSKKMSLNASKTVFMLVNKKLINCSHLSLTINGLSICPTTETVFLGLTVDCRLKWLVHVNRKIAAAKRVYFSLRAALKSTWGYDKYRLKFLYYSVVEPFLLYGCSVWAPMLSSKKNIKLLRSFQRSVTLPLSSAFKSVSTESCLALSNILPIDLRVLETTYMRYYSNSTGCFSFASSKWLTSRLPGLTASTKYDLPMLHSHPLLPPWEPFLQPSLLVEGCELLAPNDKSVCIFVAATAVSRGSWLLRGD